MFAFECSGSVNPPAGGGTARRAPGDLRRAGEDGLQAPLQLRLSAHQAASAPASAVAELEVVRQPWQRHRNCMKFRFASWNVNNRTAQKSHLDLISRVRPDIIALQEVSPGFQQSLASSGMFAWWASSLVLRAPADSEGRSRRLGCSLFGASTFTFRSASLLEDVAFPERTLAVAVDGAAGPLVACSFHIPPGASWGAIKPTTMRSIASWLARLEGSVIFGIDANAPKSDHPDIARNTWWWEGESDLLGATPTHHLRDALRSYLQAHPEELASIVASRPVGPLAVSHVRGNKQKRTSCRYDFVYHTPDLRVESIEYLYEEALAAGSDHAIVITEVEALTRRCSGLAPLAAELQSLGASTRFP